MASTCEHTCDHICNHHKTPPERKDERKLLDISAYYTPFSSSPFVLAVIKLGRIRQGMLFSEEVRALHAEIDRLGIDTTDKRAVALALEGEQAKIAMWKALYKDPRADPTDLLPEWLKTPDFLALMKNRLEPRTDAIARTLSEMSDPKKGQNKPEAASMP